MEDDEAINEKLKALLENKSLARTIDNRLRFIPDYIQTDDLQRLADSTAEALETAQRGGEDTSLSFCDLKIEEGNDFIGVYGEFKGLYIRDGYDELYKAICTQWRIPTQKSVILLGNAGTGKSWFQMYVLRRLLRRTREYPDDRDEYDFVFREVNDEMFLIDIKAKVVYRVVECDIPLLGKLSRCLYFFEPGSNVEKSPSAVRLPSLSSLSPYKKRIKEYKKGPTVQFYFWPWSLTELMALCEHTGCFSPSKIPEGDKEMDENSQK